LGFLELGLFLVATGFLPGVNTTLWIQSLRDYKFNITEFFCLFLGIKFFDQNPFAAPIPIPAGIKYRQVIGPGCNPGEEEMRLYSPHNPEWG